MVGLGAFPPATPNTDLAVPVTTAAAAASMRIEPGTAVLVARGNAAAKLQAEALPGSTVTLRLILQPDWSVVSDAIGGGPLLVRDGAPVYRSNEGFTTSQLAPRGPRTAVGQRADGGIVLLTTDGRQPGLSVGMTNFELAQALVRFGAVRGMGLDGGGSSTLAFEGTVLNSPSDGRERAVSTALMLQYYGVYALPPLETVVSPNGDGVAETQKLSYKIVRPSTVTATLTAPDGSIAWQEAGSRVAWKLRRRVSTRAAAPARGCASFDHAAADSRRALDAHGDGCSTTRASARRRRVASPSTPRSARCALLRRVSWSGRPGGARTFAGRRRVLRA